MTHRPDDPFGFDDDERSDPDDLFGRRDPRTERKSRPRVVSDFVRRAIENTVGSVGTGSNISRDAFEVLDKGRKEVLRIVANEVGTFLRNTDLSSEVVKILSGLQLELNATVRFRPAEPRPQPQTPAPEPQPRSSVSPRPSEALEPSVQVSLSVSDRESRESQAPARASEAPSRPTEE